MKNVGTLKELDVKPGDVVEYIPKCDSYTIAENERIIFEDGKTLRYWAWNTCSDWRIISRASDNPKLWRDMTPEEKGSLLLAAHEGKVIEGRNETWDDDCWMTIPKPSWNESSAYRVRPEPKVETVTIYGSPSKHVQWCLEQCGLDTHRITFNTINGKPDCASIKMEAL